jgi:hypothetical protein
MSGYAFFSTKDAQRYINNGHIKDCRMKPTFWSEIPKDGTGIKFHVSGQFPMSKHSGLFLLMLTPDICFVICK